MSWRVFDELDDILKEKPREEIVDEKEIEIIVEIRRTKEYFDKLISAYLRKYNIKIGDLSKKDINLITKNYNDNQKDLFIQQVMYHLETTWGKPLSRIKEHHLSKLLEEEDV